MKIRTIDVKIWSVIWQPSITIKKCAWKQKQKFFPYIYPSKWNERLNIIILRKPMGYKVRQKESFIQMKSCDTISYQSSLIETRKWWCKRNEFLKGMTQWRSNGYFLSNNYGVWLFMEYAPWKALNSTCNPIWNKILVVFKRTTSKELLLKTLQDGTTNWCESKIDVIE